MDIFVGNLSFDTNEGDIKKLFEGFGNVASVVIVTRKEKKAPKSRGFGFVQMPDEQQALAAIAAFNGKEFMGRVLNVNPARPKAEAQAENELKEKR
ncbi:MAG: RNA-binding protein, partial [Candidatus Omnitrophota bacterium]